MAKHADCRVTVIIPTLNESKGIFLTLHEFMNKLPNAEFLVVDGQSTDGTIEVVQAMRNVKLEILAGGKGVAIKRAIECLNSGTHPDYVVFTDGDYTYPADAVPTMIEKLQEDGRIGMVIGNRFHGRNIRECLLDMYYFGNLVLRGLHIVVNKVKHNDPLSGLRVVRWEAIKNWYPKSKGFDIEIEMNIYIRNKGWRIVEYPIEYRPRVGKKKLRFWHGAQILLRMLKEVRVL